jgi:hypothetical protein
MSLHHALLIVACVCFGLAAIGAAIPRINLVAAGLFCASLTWFV